MTNRPPLDFDAPGTILRWASLGALFVVNHSGGKDSQAMTALIRKLVPASQILVVHATLPGVEWPGVIEHIEATIGELELEICQAGKTFFDMVRHRQAFPSPKYRQCTSDLKRDPINKVIRRVARERGAEMIINCTGIRAEESAARARQTRSSVNKRLTIEGRKVIDFKPIFDMTEAEVFAAIARAGQEPHPVYAAGMSRLSCCFCIMASRADLTTAARLAPELYAQTCALEREVGFTMNMAGIPLEDVTGITPDLARYCTPTNRGERPCT